MITTQIIFKSNPYYGSGNGTEPTSSFFGIHPNIIKDDIFLFRKYCLCEKNNGTKETDLNLFVKELYVLSSLQQHWSCISLHNRSESVSHEATAQWPKIWYMVITTNPKSWLFHDILLEVRNWWKQEHNYKTMKHLRKKYLYFISINLFVKSSRNTSLPFHRVKRAVAMPWSFLQASPSYPIKIINSNEGTTKTWKLIVKPVFTI